ncbi:hypothetical protein [Cyanobacterium sp. uoEpiScrs1]|uniref:hypothetical protein n=1 Tax=Cyanobacterium sp. uoEpiScrs1 TaxID=2976343 RepID=UPI00226A1BB1|nr:hypothetical protein [Cyanobacterium sp. uoEpiScrs1]
MSQKNSPGWKQRLKDLEAEINQKSEQSPVQPFKTNKIYKGLLVRFVKAYNNLSVTTKIVLAIVVIIATLSLLNSILRLVMSVIMIGIFGVILFALYKILFKNKSY